MYEDLTQAAQEPENIQAYDGEFDAAEALDIEIEEQNSIAASATMAAAMLRPDAPGMNRRTALKAGAVAAGATAGAMALGATGIDKAAAADRQTVDTAKGLIQNFFNANRQSLIEIAADIQVKLDKGGNQTSRTITRRTDRRDFPTFKVTLAKQGEALRYKATFTFIHKNGTHYRAHHYLTLRPR